MRNFGKALRLYLKLSFNPIVTLFGILFMLIVLIAAALSPEPHDSDEYISMIACVSFGELGAWILCITGSGAFTKNKFFASLPFAKALFTAAPTVASAIFSLIYYGVAVTVAILFWEPAALPDLLIFVPIYSAVMCLAVSAAGKPRLQRVCLICFIFISLQPVVLPNISLTAHGFGLPALPAGIIGALIFIGGIAVSLAVTNMWWKKCDRVYRGIINLKLSS